MLFFIPHSIAAVLTRNRPGGRYCADIKALRTTFPGSGVGRANFTSKSPRCELYARRGLHAIKRK